jgi:hypothetical protein
MVRRNTSTLSYAAYLRLKMVSASVRCAALEWYYITANSMWKEPKSPAGYAAILIKLRRYAAYLRRRNPETVRKAILSESNILTIPNGRKLICISCTFMILTLGFQRWGCWVSCMGR